MKNNGEPAFPKLDTIQKQFDSCGNPCTDLVILNSNGMSLRDYFAAKAMQGIIIAHWGHTSFEVLVQGAFKLADAMLEEREKYE